MDRMDVKEEQNQTTGASTERLEKVLPLQDEHEASIVSVGLGFMHCALYTDRAKYLQASSGKETSPKLLLPFPVHVHLCVPILHQYYTSSTSS